MADDDRMRVESVWKDNLIKSHDPAQRTGAKEGKNKGKNREKRRTKDFFAALSKRAEVKNHELEQKGLPYRFCIYAKSDEIFIDVVTLNADGKIEKTVKKNITDEDFDRMMDDMSILEGLFLDTNA